MYIHPFLAGVLATVMVGLLLMIGYGWYLNNKDKKNKK